MFLPNSRYAKVATVQTSNGPALKLRRLTPLTGDPLMVQAGDRLDLLAQALNGDATQFWHIADANSALDSRTLTAEPGDTLVLPRS
ncbi:hypothetical protein ACVW0Y_001121 [Pseudomonas sp. TE3786]